MAAEFDVGSLISDIQERDAIHIPVVPVTADGTLTPGERVSLVKGTTDHVERCAYPFIAIGIVDPFLAATVNPGQRFWLFLFPKTITSLRHKWTHPAFPDAEPTGVLASANDIEEAREWLRAFASANSIVYSEMVEGAVSGKGACFHDDDGPVNVRIAGNQFWDCIELVTGKRISSSHREGTYFRCSC